MQEYFVAEDSIVAIKNAKALDAQGVGEAIEELRQRRAGEFSPEDLWKEARDNPSHPAYRHFDWDVREASEKWWTHQSRALIRLVSTSLPGRTDAVPAFVSLPSETGRRQYYPIAEVIDSEDLLDRLLAQAEKEAQAFATRYARFQELKEVAIRLVQAAKKQREEIASRRKRLRHGGDQPAA